MTLEQKSISDCTRQFDSQSPYLPEFREFLRRSCFVENTATRYLGHARHFLIWLHQSKHDIVSIDDVILRQFRDHDCTCWPYHKAWLSGNHPHIKRVMTGVYRLVDYLEQEGHTYQPSPLYEVQDVLDRLTTHLLTRGYRESTIQCINNIARHFLYWLHRSRIPVSQLDAKTVERFFGHDCVCGPCLTGISDHKSSRISVRRFIKFLVLEGLVDHPSLIPPQKTKPHMPEFEQWLRRHRGIQDVTIVKHVRHVNSLLPLLGDPTYYDAIHIRTVLLQQFQSCSVRRAGALADSFRHYLRYLSAEGVCSPSLLNAVPSVKRWTKTELPRYLSPEDIEKVIDTCDLSKPVGLRNRAMFLLMMRLGLRPGDIKALKFADLDWSKAQIRVCGKARHTVALPLPQDAGNAVLDYLEKARPKSADEHVFLTAREPCRPIGNSNTISGEVTTALQRAGIEQTSRMGAGVFRHSAATNLLRGGASLNELQTLLRHRHFGTTTIYAKVDVPMLQEVAQPWLGAGQ